MKGKIRVDAYHVTYDTPIKVFETFKIIAKVVLFYIFHVMRKIEQPGINSNHDDNFFSQNSLSVRDTQLLSVFYFGMPPICEVIGTMVKRMGIRKCSFLYPIYNNPIICPLFGIYNIVIIKKFLLAIFTEQYIFHLIYGAVQKKYHGFIETK